MEFDVVIMNPPYQAKTKNNNKGTNLWDKFIACAVNIVKQGGLVAAIHPSGWRNVSGMFSETKNILQGKKLHYLSIHNADDGLKTFGCATRYDWYVMENSKSDPLYKTEIDCEDEEKVKFQICELPFIPNFDFGIFDLVAKPGEEKVQILYSRTAYGADKSHVSKIQDEKNCYPVIYSVSTSGPTIFWSSTTANGHYGIKKLIFNPNNPTTSLLDNYGLYGMSQWCVGITGDDKYLKMVKKVFDNQKTNGFNDCMEACHVTDTIFNRRVFKEFRKDFYKEFL